MCTDAINDAVDGDDNSIAPTLFRRFSDVLQSSTASRPTVSRPTASLWGWAGSADRAGSAGSRGRRRWIGGDTDGDTYGDTDGDTDGCTDILRETLTRDTSMYGSMQAACVYANGQACRGCMPMPMC